MPIPGGSTTYTWPPTNAEVDRELNLGVDTSQDSGLTGFIDAISRVIENIVGPVTATPYTETHNGGGPTLILRRTPVVSIQSITEYVGLSAYPLTNQPLGSTVDNYGYTLDDPDLGLVVRRGSNGLVIPFMGGSRAVTVTYTAGRATVPANVRQAALELIRLHWKPQRAAGPSTLGTERAGDDDFNAVTILGFYVPGKVLELLEPDKRGPGIA